MIYSYYCGSRLRLSWKKNNKNITLWRSYKLHIPILLIKTDLSVLFFIIYIFPESTNKILKIFLWKNQFGIECGIELNFSNGELLIFNMGDDLMIYEAQPDFLVSEGYVRFE